MPAVKKMHLDKEITGQYEGMVSAGNKMKIEMPGITLIHRLKNTGCIR